MLEKDKLEGQYSEILKNTFIRENTLDLLSNLAINIDNYEKKDFDIKELSIYALESSRADGCIEMYTSELEKKFNKDFSLNEIFEFGQFFPHLNDLHELEIVLTEKDIQETVINNYKKSKALTKFANTKLALFSFLEKNKALPHECEKEYFSLLINKNRNSLNLV